MDRSTVEENNSRLYAVLVVQTLDCLTALVLQAFCFRWYNFLGALIGLCVVYIGVKGVRDSKDSFLNVFIIVQLLVSIVLLFGAIFTFRAIEYYEDYDGYCSPKSIYYIAAVFMPIGFVSVLFASIYARRASNLMNMHQTFLGDLQDVPGPDNP